MSIATSTAVSIGVGAAGLAGSAIASHSAGKAAQTQADAANHAADVQAASADKALQYQKETSAPWIAAGTDALSKLKDYPQFQVPGADFTTDPGYQFRVAQGMKAIQNSAAARGNLLSGGTEKALQDYSQNEASNEYQNVYNRRYQQYSDQYNRTAGLAGVGATASTNFGNNASNIELASGQQQGTALENAGAARASGYAANGNIWGNTLSGFGNDLLSQYTLKNVLNRPGATPGISSNATLPVPGSLPYQSAPIEGSLIQP